MSKNNRRDYYLTRRIPCGVCAGPTGYVQGDARAPERPICRDCKAASPLPHGTRTGYRRGCRCQECRDATNTYLRTYWQAKKSAAEPVAGITRRATCERCGAEFLAEVRKPGKFCSRACKRGDLTPGERRRRSVRWRAAERRIAKQAKGTSGGNLVWVQGACARCGEQFAPSRGIQSRYCSLECRRRSDAEKAGWIDQKSRLAIYRAARWRCQICGDRMSRTYSTSDPLSPTLDHITPRSKGGSDDPLNLRAAHLFCNSVRGDGRTDLMIPLFDLKAGDPNGSNSAALVA